MQIGSLTELNNSDVNERDFGAISYDPSGSIQWKLRHDFQGNSDSAQSGAFDSAGKLYLVGNTFSTPSSGNALILKFRVP